jgi:hypothetical protein
VSVLIFIPKYAHVTIFNLNKNQNNNWLKTSFKQNQGCLFMCVCVYQCVSNIKWIQKTKVRSDKNIDAIPKPIEQMVILGLTPNSTMVSEPIVLGHPLFIFTCTWKITSFTIFYKLKFPNNINWSKFITHSTN